MAFSTLEKLMAAIIGIDILAPGTSRKAVEAALQRVLPTATAAPKAPVSPRIGGGVPGAVVTGATLTALAAMEQAQRDAAMAQNLQIPIPLYNPVLGDVPTIEIPIDKRTPKRKISGFNRAVREGMKAVRASRSYGKKGQINNAKRAFAAVNKVASKVNRGKKVSNKGITGIIARAVRKKL